ncbi:BCCT family transporter [Candidatus Marinarcus aquaticus]|uniref:Glycine/betaine ABC transporter n=1 Tax=Candidatus Marinarcus aquaticus TaxID=2044504 RepID=A0A4Q0XSR1_9BACT|nr:BCCT family transporter [Candidatus Marinarcus aquaticus]RXJ60557.1 glycine/betaine ABC transporter [Candidatus Marinarcus aquaticus]
MTRRYIISKAAYKTDYEVGQDNVEILGMDIHNPVFFLSALLILLFVITTIMFPTVSKEVLDGAKWWAINHFDWLFMSAGNFFVLFCLALIFLPVGKIRLGGNDAKPEFSRISWFSMLFAAGMGIGLMFWSVAEPVAYYTAWYKTPLGVEANTAEAASLAMGATMYHWGVHPWAIYGVVALSLAFFAYNKKLPLTIRSAFYPLLKERIWGWPGHLIDLLAVLATIFGLATSLGLGAKQAASGLNYVFETGNDINVQIGIIIFITAVAIFSVVRGIDGGVKLLSNLNMLIAFILLVFIILVGTSTGFLSVLFNTFTSYMENIIPLSNFVNREDEAWLHGWTVFYWAWWISWSPFVGMFIARISKGRTVQEFMIAILIIPTLITMVWMSAFGGTAIEQVQNHIGELSNGISTVSLAMFQMFDNLAWSSIISVLGIVLVLVFFVTSSDSGSLVIDSITAGGKMDAPVPQRVFWATMEGLIAGALLFVGGKDALSALQAGAITTGLPFAVVLLFMSWSLYKGLKSEVKS